ncbi:hypothetical protein [Xenorhabdus cabanillasii]|nr:hypothetical protein [Xenorhabdus cabanillasii]
MAFVQKLCHTFLISNEEYAIMFYSRYLTYLGNIGLLLPALARAQMPTEQLSQKQKIYLQQQITKQVTDKSALKYIKKWSDAKKIAEFICRPYKGK